MPLFQQKYNTTPVQLQLEFNEEIKNDSPNDDFDKSIDKILGFKEDWHNKGCLTKTPLRSITLVPLSTYQLALLL